MPERLKFFGKDARPIAEVVMRRHPLAFALYTVVFLLGMIFVTHFGYGTHTEHDLFPGVSPIVIVGWKVMMVGGGGGAVLTLLARPRPSPHWPDIADLLHLEGIASGVAGMGLLVYLVSVINVQGLHTSGPAIVYFGTLIAGHVVRGRQAIRDSIRLKELARAAAITISDAEDEQDVRDGF